MMVSNRNLLFQGAPIFRWTMFVLEGVSISVPQNRREQNPCQDEERPSNVCDRDPRPVATSMVWAIDQPFKGWQQILPGQAFC